MPKIAVFSAGLVAGAVSAFAWSTADTLKDRSILGRAFRFLCQANQDASWDCSSFMSILAIIIILLTLAGVVYEVRREDDWRIGLLFYLAGLALSFGVLFFALA